MILTDPEWQAVLLSLKVSSLAVVFSLPFGIFFAWLLVRRSFPGKALLDGLIHLPLVLPPVVVGYLLLIALGRRGFIGSWLYDWFGLTFAFSWRGAVTADAARYYRRHRAGLCPLARRVWRDHYLCVEYSRRNPYHPIRNVYPDSDTRRRKRGGASVLDFHRAGADFADDL